MRFFLVLLIWAVFLGGTLAYTAFREKAPDVRPEETAVAALSDAFSLEVSATFTMAPDGFFLRTDEADAPCALRIRMGDNEIFRAPGPLTDHVIRIEGIAGIKEGYNEMYVEAVPAAAPAGAPRAMRLRLFRDGRPLAETAMWAGPGEIISDAFWFHVPARKKLHGHE